jgi:glucose-1-phosphate adenylyltransferase
METDATGRITNFVEKPQTADEMAPLRMPAAMLKELGRSTSEEAYQASMGIYIFKRKALFESLDNDLIDFGKHVIPEAIKRYHVCAYPFLGYWEDIGTIGSFYEANLDLCKLVPEYDFFDFSAQIYTNARFLPASKINGAKVRQAIVSDGCIITDAVIENSIIGIRSIIETGSTVKDSVIMGADYFNSEVACHEDLPPLGIGHNCTITRAIVDKNVRIGNNVVISPEGKEEGAEEENYVIRDGIIVIPKGAVIPDGTWI